MPQQGGERDGGLRDHFGVDSDGAVRGESLAEFRAVDWLDLRNRTVCRVRRFRLRRAGDGRTRRVQRRTVLAPHETALDEQFSLRIDDHERARLRHLLCIPHESAAFECDDRGVDPFDFSIEAVGFLICIFIVLGERFQLPGQVVLQHGERVHLALFVFSKGALDGAQLSVAVEFQQVALDAGFCPAPTLGAQFFCGYVEFLCDETLQQFGIGNVACIPVVTEEVTADIAEMCCSTFRVLRPVGRYGE